MTTLDGDGLAVRRVPTFFFADTDGKWITLHLRVFTSNSGLGFDLGGYRADEFQIYRKTTNIPFVSGMTEKVLNIRGNGHIVPDATALVPAKLHGEVKIGNDWYSITKLLRKLT